MAADCDLEAVAAGVRYDTDVVSKVMTMCQKKSIKK